MSSGSEQGAASFYSVSLTNTIQDVTLNGQPCFCGSEAVSTKPLGAFNHVAEGPIGGPDEAETI